MGIYDSFHPVSANDLQHFVYDVLDTPSILETRLATLTDQADAMDAVRAMFARTPEALELRAEMPDREIVVTRLVH